MPIEEVWPRYKQIIKVKASTKAARDDADSGLSINSLNTSRYTLTAFTAWLQKTQQIQYLHEVTPAIAEQYAVSLRESSAAGTFNRKLADLRVIFRRLANQAGLHANPWDSIEKVRGARLRSETASKRPFTPDQLATIWETARGWIRPAVMLGYYTALRLGTICTLKWETIDLVRGIIEARERKTSKLGIFYAPEAIPVLLEWKAKEEPSEYVFPRLAASYLAIGRKRDQTRASKEFQRFLKTIKIDTQDEAGHTVLGFHSLRVSHATYSAGSGATMADIQAALMHSNQRTTAGYVQLSDEQRIHDAMQSDRPLPIPGSESTELISTRAAVMRRASTADIDTLRRMLDV